MLLLAVLANDRNERGSPSSHHVLQALPSFPNLLKRSQVFTLEKPS